MTALDADIRRLFAAGTTDADIAAALHTTPARVARRRQVLGLLRRASPAESVPDDELLDAHSRLTTEHNRPPTADELAAATGLRRSSVLERLSRLRTDRPGDLAVTKRRRASDLVGYALGALDPDHALQLEESAARSPDVAAELERVRALLADTEP